jgi:hypothetical protein
VFWQALVDNIKKSNSLYIYLTIVVVKFILNGDGWMGNVTHVCQKQTEAFPAS